MRKNIGLVAVMFGCTLACAAGFAQEPVAEETSAPDSASAADAPATEAQAAEPAAAEASVAETPATEAPANDAPVAEAEPLATIPVGQETPPALEETREPAVVQLEDIVITATKREKSRREIPASIGEFSGTRLENEGKFNLIDFIEQKPGVAMAVIAPNVIRISIRGISTDAHGGSPLPGPTGVLIGDTAFGDPFINNMQPDFAAFDLSRVEILKGPQGTLFGGSALAGAIRYVLQDPVMGEWQARAFSQYDAPKDGTPETSHGMALNAPLGDNIALRLGYVNRKYPGVTDNSRMPRREDVDGTDSEQFRGIFSWQPLSQLGIKFTHLQADSFTANAISFADRADGPRENNKKVLPQPSLTDFSLDSLEVGYDFENMRLVGLASRTAKNWYINVDISAAITGPPDPNQPFDRQNGTFQITDDQSKSLSQELRLQSTGKEGLQWLVGLYNADYKVFFEILDDTVRNHELHQTLGTDPDVYRETTVLYAVTNVKAYERAAFFDVGYKFWDRLELTAGARLYQTQVLGGFFGTGVLARQQNNGQSFDFSDQALKEKGVSPKFTATYQLNPNISTYLNASRGYRFGGLQTVPSTDSNGVPPAYKSDTLWNYEIGARTTWFDNTLHFDTTFFYIDYKNPQVVQRTNSATGINLTYIDNVDSAVSRGFEAELAWLTPLDGVRLELAGGVTDARTTVPFTAASPYSSSPVVVPAGARLPGAAKSQYSAAIAYNAPPIGIFDISGRLDYNYIGKGFGDIIQAHAINDYGTLNASLTLASAAWTVKPRLSFNVTNLTDETAPKLGFAVRSVPGPIYDIWNLNAPRTFSLRLGLEF